MTDRFDDVYHEAYNSAFRRLKDEGKDDRQADSLAEQYATDVVQERTARMKRGAQADQSISRATTEFLSPKELWAAFEAALRAVGADQDLNRDAMVSADGVEAEKVATPYRIHLLKTWPQFFPAVATNEKQFEIRRNDRDYKVGDILVLQEWNPHATHRSATAPAKGYTGFWCVRVVTYVLSAEDAPSGLTPGYVIMSLRLPERHEADLARAWEEKNK